jgi:hypothetical protein
MPHRDHTALDAVAMRRPATAYAATRKDTMRKKNKGQFDPERARKAAQARWSREPSKRGPERDSKSHAHEPHGGGELDPGNPPDVDLTDLPLETLRELTGKKYPGYVRVRAAEALHRIEPEPSRFSDFRQSVQVRPDYVPPSPLEVVKVWYAAGALEDNDLRKLMAG